MQSKGKDDTGRFMRAIAAFSAAPEKITRLGRPLSRGTGTSLNAILTEINETVLRRTLRFRKSDASEITLDVAERRILALSTQPSKAAGSDPAAPGGQVSDSDAVRVMKILEDFADGEDEIFVLSQLPDPASPSGFGGLAVRLLFDLAEQRVMEGASPDLLEALEATKAYANAMVASQNGRIGLRWGDGDTCAMLEPLHVARAGTSVVADSLCLWHGGFPLSQAVLAVHYGDLQLNVVCAQGAMTECFGIWQQLVCGTVA